MLLRYFLLLLLLQNLNCNANEESVPYVVCVAYNYTLSKQLLRVGDVNGSNELITIADQFSDFAIKLDKKEGLPSWITGSLIGQLMTEFNKQAETNEGFVKLAERHNKNCVDLARRFPEGRKKHFPDN